MKIFRVNVGADIALPNLPYIPSGNTVIIIYDEKIIKRLAEKRFLTILTEIDIEERKPRKSKEPKHKKE